MNEHIIQEWNKVMIHDTDIMLDLGDTFFRGTRLIDSIFPRLHGQCIEIRGNHTYNKQIRYMSKYSNYCCVPHLDFKYRGYHFWCAHNPCDKWFEQVDWENTCNILCAGHWHSSAPVGLQYCWRGVPWNNSHGHGGEQLTNEVYLPGLSYNVSLDVIGYKPIALDQIVNEINDWKAKNVLR